MDRWHQTHHALVNNQPLSSSLELAQAAEQSAIKHNAKCIDKLNIILYRFMPVLLTSATCISEFNPFTNQAPYQFTHTPSRHTKHYRQSMVLDEKRSLVEYDDIYGQVSFGCQTNWTLHNVSSDSYLQQHTRLACHLCNRPVTTMGSAWCWIFHNP